MLFVFYNIRHCQESVRSWIDFFCGQLLVVSLFVNVNFLGVRDVRFWIAYFGLGDDGS